MIAVEIRKDILKKLKGGPGSGHFGHRGRPGEVGGSLPSGSGVHAYALTATAWKQPPFGFYADYYKAPQDFESLLAGKKIKPTDSKLGNSEWLSQTLGENYAEGTAKRLSNQVRCGISNDLWDSNEMTFEEYAKLHGFEQLVDITSPESCMNAIRALTDITDEETGYRLVLNGISDTVGGSVWDGDSLTGVSIEAVILDKSDDFIGKFSFILGSESDDVELSLLSLNTPNQGTGFGTRLVQRFETIVGALGYSRVSLVANIDVGGYTWARMGYDFMEDSTSEDLIEGFTSFLKKETVDGRRVPKSVVSNFFPSHSWDIAAFSYKGVKFGKEYLLGSRWYGVKDLYNDEVGRLYYEAFENKS